MSFSFVDIKSLPFNLSVELVDSYSNCRNQIVYQVKKIFPPYFVVGCGLITVVFEGTILKNPEIFNAMLGTVHCFRLSHFHRHLVLKVRPFHCLESSEPTTQLCGVIPHKNGICVIKHLPVKSILIDHLQTEVERTPEIYFMLRMPQTMGSVEHNTYWHNELYFVTDTDTE